MRKHLIVVVLVSITILVSVVSAQEEVILYEGAVWIDKREFCLWIFEDLKEGERLSWVIRCELQSEECKPTQLFIAILEEYEQKINLSQSSIKRYYNGTCTLFEEKQIWTVPFDGDWILTTFNTQVLSVKIIYRISKLPPAPETSKEAIEQPKVPEFPFS